MTWTIQDLGPHKPDYSPLVAPYPDWLTYAIRDTKTNVCLAVVGDVDRYFEGQYLKIAQLMRAAPELLEACKAAARYGDFSQSPEVLDLLKSAIASV